MAIQPNNTLSTLASGTPGTFLTTDSSGSISWSKRDEDKMIDFIEFALEIIGVDLKIPISKKCLYMKELHL